MRHPSMATEDMMWHADTQTSGTGATYARIPIRGAVPLDPAAADWFMYRGEWVPPGEVRTAWHCTPLQNLEAILNDGALRTGPNGTPRGVYCHEVWENAGFYVTSARLMWPLEPLCVIELRVNNVKKIHACPKAGPQG